MSESVERVQTCCVVVGIVVIGVVGKRRVVSRAEKTSDGRAEKVNRSSERRGELAPWKAKREDYVPEESSQDSQVYPE